MRAQGVTALSRCDGQRGRSGLGPSSSLVRLRWRPRRRHMTTVTTTALRGCTQLNEQLMASVFSPSQAFEWAQPPSSRYTAPAYRFPRKEKCLHCLPRYSWHCVTGLEQSRKELEGGVLFKARAPLSGYL